MTRRGQDADETMANDPIILKALFPEPWTLSGSAIWPEGRGLSGSTGKRSGP